jgi:hypothetical protein
MQRTTALLDRRKRPEPSQEFWDNYYDRVSARLQQQSPAPFPFAAKESRRSWYYLAAAAAAILVFGIVVGRYFLDRPIPEIVTHPAPRPAQTDTLQVRTGHFLQQSEVLLLAVVNSSEPSGLEPIQPRQTSQSLLTQASGLKEELQDADEQRLRRLVEELEIILLQIEKLENKKDQSGIDLVRSGVDQRSVLLKIDLEQMKLEDSRTASKKTTQGEL